MSSINPNNINGQYPIAGQDNDSQGFRDNFTNIKNNFTYAYNEITDLQNNAILKSAIAGGSVDNDMNYTQLVAPQILKSVETKNDLGTKSGSFSISWADAHFQLFTASGDCTISSFTNWPSSSNWTKLRLQITPSVTCNITFPSAVSVNISNIQGYSGSQIVRLQAGSVYIFELSTYDQGSTIVIEDVSRNYKPRTLILNPTANVAITANIDAGRIHLAPTGAIVSFGANVTLPNANVNALTVSISSNVTIAQLAVYGAVGTSVDPHGNITLAAGASASYYFDASTAKWFKVA